MTDTAQEARLKFTYGPTLISLAVILPLFVASIAHVKPNQFQFVESITFTLMATYASVAGIYIYIIIKQYGVMWWRFGHVAMLLAAIAFGDLWAAVRLEGFWFARMMMDAHASGVQFQANWVNINNIIASSGIIASQIIAIFALEVTNKKYWIPTCFGVLLIFWLIGIYGSEYV